eukprot:TRINITY_DN93381_c0_g1_i1.p1 TRINITY_DN93381_c0_g1~~TRINITY_DN93381_c0_g1_i1.p1  ORF type:complete len:386 (-),score=79.95 TRINITY_DN93381_c0_g1_i1:314-1471(-)
MAAWALSGKFSGTGFLCVCVDPNALATAKEFSQLYFPSAPDSLINGFIDSQSDFPNFQAQLGCQGFIIFNSACQLVASKTLPFLEYRDQAFRDVEGKLMQMLQPPPPQNPLNAPLGQHVRIINLTSDSGKAMNGVLGEIVGSSDNGRFLVKTNDATKAFRPENLEDATDAPIGERFQVYGLTSEKGQKLNGQEGEIVGGTANGRYIVRLSGSTMSLKKENLRQIEAADTDALQYLAGVASVGHDAMDAQHDTCIQALKELWQDLSVKALKFVREQLQSHFDEEEVLLQKSGFGPEESCCGASNDFSALASHAKDHKRIISLADDALAQLTNVCHASDAHGGTVPRQVAMALCKAFAEHARLYDALYEGKVASHDAPSLEQMNMVD